MARCPALPFPTTNDRNFSRRSTALTLASGRFKSFGGFLESPELPDQKRSLKCHSGRCNSEHGPLRMMSGQVADATKNSRSPSLDLKSSRRQFPFGACNNKFTMFLRAVSDKLSQAMLATSL